MFEAPARLAATGSQAGSDLDLRATGVILDFGRELAGRAQADIGPGSTGGVILTYGESLAELERERPDEPYPVRVEVAASGEPKRWSDSETRGFRYLRIRGSIGTGIETRMLVHGVAVASEQRPPLDAQTGSGQFTSSDPGLDRAWLAGVETARLCTSPGPLGVVLDGVKRDRAVWAADLAVAARVLYASTGDSAPIARSLERLASLRGDAEGSRQPIAATDYQGGGPELVDYGAWWMVALRDYWRETGDAALIDRLYPRLAAQAGWTLARIEPDGLVHKHKGELEWCYTLGRTGAVTAVNAVASAGLEAAAELARGIGRTAQGDLWLGASRSIRDAARALLWDRSSGTFATSNEDRERLSLDANALPLWLDWLSAADADRALRAIRARLWLPWGPANVDRPYPNPDGPEHDRRVWPFLAYFEADARLRPGRDASDGFELLRRTWEPMLARDPGNTFWEWIGPDGAPEHPRTSLAHAWSGGISAVLSERVLGVRVVAPRRYEIAPVTGDLGFAKGTRPTPWGPIRVSWTRDSVSGRFQVDTEMPEGTSLDRLIVPVPSGDARLDLDGRVVVGESDLGGDRTFAGGTGMLERGPGFVAIQVSAALRHRVIVESASQSSPSP